MKPMLEEEPREEEEENQVPVIRFKPLDSTVPDVLRPVLHSCVSHYILFFCLN